MVVEKISVEQLLATVDVIYQPFVRDLHSYLMESGCKASFELKKSGPLASYKLGKPIRAVVNFGFRKEGMFVRIYAEHLNKYEAFLNTLPEQMAKGIAESSTCRRLAHGTCSPKCAGYEFELHGEHFQKCRYSCFELFLSEEGNPFIKTFVENEINARTA